MARVVWVGGGLVLTSLNCLALSLGNVQGPVLIGRPLDVSVPFALGTGETVAEGCAKAKVFFADEVVSAVNIKTAVSAKSLSAGTTVRVQTTLPVSETFVRMELQLGCDQFISRSYVLLADLPASPPSDTAPRTQSATAIEPPSVATKAVPVEAAQVSATSSSRAKRTQIAAVPTRKPTADRSRPVADGPSETVKSTAPRLTLDPVELVAAANQMQPALRLSVDVPVDAGESDALLERRKTARLLWRTLNDSPEQLAAQALSAEISTAEVARVKTALAAAQQAAADAQAQLQQEEASRYSNPLFLGTLAALCAALGGVWALWRRTERPPVRGAATVWPKSVEPESKVPTTAVSNPVRTFWNKLRPATPSHAKPRTIMAAQSFHGTYVDTLMPEDEWEKPINSSHPLRERRASHGRTDFSRSTLLDVSRSVVAEELFDLQQQVEFYISLGQADQAIDLLNTYLSDHDVVSPLVFLDLLKLYHELGRRDDFSNLQKKYNGAFHQNYPNFDEDFPVQLGLENYERALSQIQLLWPRSEVLQTIEECILRDVFDSTFPVMTLEAYRELLLLYAIARDFVDSDAVSTGTSIGQSKNQPAPDSVFGQAHTIPMAMTMASAVSGAVLFPSAADEIGLKDRGQPMGMPKNIEPSIDIGKDSHLDLDLSLDDSIFQQSVASSIDRAEPDVLLTDLPDISSATSDAVETGQQVSGMLDLDFSDLSGTDAFTIRKSGQVN